MSVIVNISITPIVDPAIPDSDGTVDTLPSIYQNTYFEANIAFAAINDITLNPESITSVTCTPPFPSVTVSVVSNDPTNYILKVSGTITGSIFSETFSYVLQDETLVTTSGNVSNMLSIYEWSPPDIKIINTSYPFIISISGVGNVSANIAQYIYWNLEPSLNSFQQLVSISL